MALFAVAILAGCQKKEEAAQLVTSERRVINEAEEAGAPSLKPGVWATHSGDCAYDPNLAAKAWPDCVQWFSVAGHQRRWSDREEPENFLLGAGDPRLMQVSGVGGEDGFRFWGLRSAGFDASGRIVKFRAWEVYCELVAAATDEAVTPEAPVADAASPAPDEPPCTADSVADLRRLAKASEREDAALWIWVRERSV